jgi:hypothetical protein
MRSDDPVLIKRRSSMSRNKVSELERRLSSLEDDVRQLLEALSAVVENKRRRIRADEDRRRRLMEAVLADL